MKIITEIQVLQKVAYKSMLPNTDLKMMNGLISGTGPKPSRRDVVFSFLSSPALWNAEPIPPGSAERKRNNKLSALCVSNERSEWVVQETVNFEL